MRGVERRAVPDRDVMSGRHGVACARSDRQRRSCLEHGSVRSQKRHRPIVVSNQTESALVDASVMAATQQDQVVEAGRAAVHPVLHVMGIAPARRAARESATPVTNLERPPNRWRHTARLAPHIEDGAVGSVLDRAPPPRRRTGVATSPRRRPPRCGRLPACPQDLPLPPHPRGPPRAAPPGTGRRQTRDRAPTSAPPPPADRGHRRDAARTIGGRSEGLSSPIGVEP